MFHLSPAMMAHLQTALNLLFSHDHTSLCHFGVFRWWVSVWPLSWGVGPCRVGPHRVGPHRVWVNSHQRTFSIWTPSRLVSRTTPVSMSDRNWPHACAWCTWPHILPSFVSQLPVFSLASLSPCLQHCTTSNYCAWGCFSFPFVFSYLKFLFAHDNFIYLYKIWSNLLSFSLPTLLIVLQYVSFLILRPHF